MKYLLESSGNLNGIVIHDDPLCTLPTAFSKARAFKRTTVQQDELSDYKNGANDCPFCNPELLDGKPTITKHCDDRVISFPNSAPFFSGDARVLCLWDRDRNSRYDNAHKYKFQDFGVKEFYYSLSAARDLALDFPATTSARMLQRDLNLIRCVAGFNIGRLAGQSIPHFHLQYGWDVYLNITAKTGITPELLQLFYCELENEGLVLYENNVFYVIVPWTPRGQYHIEIHFKEKYEISELTDREIGTLTYLSSKILEIYKGLNIKNINILFVGSPYSKHHQPLIVHFIPRVNITALYELIGVNVVDTFPEDTAHVFKSGFLWRDIIDQALQFNIEEHNEVRPNTSDSTQGSDLSRDSI